MMRLREIAVVSLAVLALSVPVSAANVKHLEGIRVDASASEWRLSQSASEALLKSSLGSIHLAHDKKHLYALAQVKDSELTIDKLSHDFSLGDYVRIGITAPQSGRQERKSLVFSLTPPTEFGHSLVSVSDVLGRPAMDFDLRQVKVATAVTDSGYAIEIQFPAAAFGLAEFQPGQRLQLTADIVSGGKADQGGGKLGLDSSDQWPIVHIQ